MVRRLQTSYCSSFHGCPDPCIGGAWGPACDCRDPDGIDADPNCLVCHSPATNEGPGCDQCDISNDYFKIDYNHNCAQCQEVFGNECLHCSDFDGCQQCQQGYERIFDEDCDVYYCRQECDNPPTGYPTQAPAGGGGGGPGAPTGFPSPDPTPNPTPNPTRIFFHFVWLRCAVILSFQQVIFLLLFGVVTMVLCAFFCYFFPFLNKSVGVSVAINCLSFFFLC